MHLLQPLFVTFVILSPAVLAADRGADDFPGIETLMSPAELQATGVGTLSGAQLRHLNAWLISYTAKDAPALIQNNAEIKTVQNKPVSSRIVGTFKGWRGKTQVTLENGEVWQQRHNGKWIVSLENPEVVIDKNVLGFYEMILVESGKAVGVKRVE